MNRRGFLGGLLAAVGLARVAEGLVSPLPPPAEVVLDPDDFMPVRRRGIRPPVKQYPVTPVVESFVITGTRPRVGGLYQITYVNGR